MRNAPTQIIEYMLCQEFGWSLTELDAQPAKRVEDFLLIMNAKAQHEQSKSKGLNKKNG